MSTEITQAQVLENRDAELRRLQEAVRSASEAEAPGLVREVADLMDLAQVAGDNDLFQAAVDMLADLGENFDAAVDMLVGEDLL